MRKPATAATALFLFALPIAGCGNTVDTNAYVKSVSAVQAKTAADSERLTKEMESAKTTKDIAQKLTELGEAIQADAADLAKVKTPSKVTTEHAAYVKLMKQFGTDLEALAPQVAKSNQGTVGTVLQKAQKLTTALSSSEAKIVGQINAELQS